MSPEWGFVCENAAIAGLCVSANEQSGGLNAAMRLHDGRKIDAHFRFMEDLAQLANDESFTGTIAFAPGDEGLRSVLETFQRSLRGDLIQ